MWHCLRKPGCMITAARETRAGAKEPQARTYQEGGQYPKIDAVGIGLGHTVAIRPRAGLHPRRIPPAVDLVSIGSQYICSMPQHRQVLVQRRSSMLTSDRIRSRSPSPLQLLPLENLFQSNPDSSGIALVQQFLYGL